jgi:hypothetical protein
MDGHEQRPPTLLDYSTPPVRERRNWSAGRRIGIGVIATLVHFVAGFAAVGIFEQTRFINAAVLTWLFPFGWAAMTVNPHRMGEAAMGNSIFCGFVFSYSLALLVRRRAGR